MDNLLIEIGNTALKAAWADGITLGKTFRYQGEKTMDFIKSITSRIKPEIMVVSTVRELSAKNIEILRGECSKLIIMDSRHKELSEKLDIPQYLTPDRVAAVIASRFLFKGKKCSIFDFGTTLTVDFLDNCGKHIGGNISPGFRTRLKSIARYSRSLPSVDIPDSPLSIGNSIVSSIESGVVSGIEYEIKGYISENPENIVVFTGGDANYFAKRMKNSIFVVCNLVLMGLALVAANYEEN